MKKCKQLTPQEAAQLIEPGMNILVGGFGSNGHPIHIMNALAEQGTAGLSYVGNNVGEPGIGAGRLLRNKQIKHATGSFFTSNPEAVKAYQTGQLDVKVIPQGTLAEALRAGGVGVPAFYTPTAAGTAITEGDEVREFNGVPHVLVPAIRGDVSVVRAYRADEAGNLQYRMSEQNFNNAIAMAGDVVIAEVEEIVPVGQIPPEQIHTPGIFVDYLVQAHLTDDDIGFPDGVGGSPRKADDTRMAIARRALQELKPGMYTNLGVGIPTLVADLIKPEDNIVLQSENGMLGVGPAPTEGSALDFPVNAGKMPVTALPGTSYFDSSTSFGMIRGKHIDVAIMGGLEVAENGDFANWAVPGKPLLGVGGAMDLASGAKRLIVTMTHVNTDGSPKIVPRCTLPLTAYGVVDMVITDKAVFEFIDGQLTLTELMPGATLEEVRATTTAHFAEKLS